MRMIRQLIVTGKRGYRTDDKILMGQHENEKKIIVKGKHGCRTDDKILMGIAYLFQYIVKKVIFQISWYTIAKMTVENSK